jgi:hypothetical protein
LSTHSGGLARIPHAFLVGTAVSFSIDNLIEYIVGTFLLEDFWEGTGKSRGRRAITLWLVCVLEAFAVTLVDRRMRWRSGRGLYTDGFLCFDSWRRRDTHRVYSQLRPLNGLGIDQATRGRGSGRGGILLLGDTERVSRHDDG